MVWFVGDRGRRGLRSKPRLPFIYCYKIQINIDMFVIMMYYVSDKLFFESKHNCYGCGTKIVSEALKIIFVPHLIITSR
jgi:hypothetical protein